MSVFEVIHAYLYDGQGMINRYHYIEALSGAGTAENLAEAFTDEIMPFVQEVQHSDVLHSWVSVKNLSFVSTDEYTIDFTGVTGGRVGNGMPTHDAAAFQLNVASGKTRSGRKSIGGIPEEHFDKGIPQPSIETFLSALSDRLSYVLQPVLGIDFWYPCIYRTSLLGLGIVNLVNNARFARVSTQNSRKGYTSSTVSRGAVASDRTIVGDNQGKIQRSGNWESTRSYDPFYDSPVPPVMFFDDQRDSVPEIPVIT